MTQEEKAKAYDEALHKAKRIINVCADDNTECRSMIACIQQIFPELKESEDEQIRKELIQYFSTFTLETFAGLSPKKIIAWLEKQEGCEYVKKDWLEHIKQSWYKEGFIDGKYTPKELTIYDAATLNELIDFLENGTEKLQHDPTLYVNWLKTQFSTNEKQGEQKPADKVEPKFKVGDKIQYLKDCGTIMTIEKIENGEYIFGNNMGYITIESGNKWYLAEQRPSDKVEPKFHKDEWITNGDYTWKIIEIKPLDYILQSQDGNIVDDTISHVDEQFHSFTIKDAKDGDVLAWDDSKCITLFKNIYDEESFNSYGFIGGCTGTFHSIQAYHDIEGAHPATKEQRDQLEKATADAGYTFDFEKKELRKIEQKSAWSEDDERNLNDAILFIETGTYSLDKDNLINWLKSIKDRVQPQPKQEWKQENTDDLTDFENAMMHIGDSFFGNNAGLDPNDTNAIKEQADLLLELVPSKEWSEEDESMFRKAIITIDNVRIDTDSSEYYQDICNWLKLLKERYTWKPSDEQIEILEMVLTNESMDDNIARILRELREQLKKLREE